MFKEVYTDHGIWTSRKVKGWSVVNKWLTNFIHRNILHMELVESFRFHTHVSRTWIIYRNINIIIKKKILIKKKKSLFMHQLVKLTAAIWLSTSGNLFPSHSCIGWPESSPPPPHHDSNPGPQIERQTTYKLSYLFPPPPYYYWIYHDFVSLNDESIHLSQDRTHFKLSVEL